MKGRLVTAVFVILFLDTFGYALLFPSLFLDPAFELLPIATTEKSFHLLLGLMLVAFPLAQFFGAPLFGRLSDSYGRRKILAFTILGTFLGDVASALSLHAHSYIFLLISQIFTGFFAANLALCMAILTDVFGTKKLRGRALCVVAAILGLSWMIAFFLVVLFSSQKFHFQPAFPFWIFALLSIFSLVVLRLFVRETAPMHACSSKKLLAHRHLRSLYLIIFFFSLGLFISFQWISPLSVIKFHVDGKGLLWTFAFVGTLWTLSSLILGHFAVSRLSLWKVNLWTLFTISLLLFFAGTADYYTYFIIAYSLAMIFGALVWGIVVTLTSMAAQEGEQGRVMGIIQSMFALSKLLSPFIGGMIAGISLEPLLYACSFFVLISFLLLLINVIRRSQREPLTQY
ncbi:MAG: hypothetical protein S4CHLAM45_08080 [Chlamydiales bacterium]|nr:hypothetical protein [Chlamydiales bacterium]MCH9620440.1 hypothetical protein [Chlamydiales bacterium]MCH9622914.1 hypothetical protein [Chlamydiales bacterium]